MNLRKGVLKTLDNYKCFHGYLESHSGSMKQSHEAVMNSEIKYLEYNSFSGPEADARNSGSNMVSSIHHPHIDIYPSISTTYLFKLLSLASFYFLYVTFHLYSLFIHMAINTRSDSCSYLCR
jgi:hypothetical protein